MQNVDFSPGIQMETRPALAASPAGDEIAELAFELAHSLKASRISGSRNPVRNRLKVLGDFIRAVYGYYEDANQQHLRIHHAAEWVLDNYYVIEQAIRQVWEGMPGDYYRRLPQVELGPQVNVARVYALSVAFTQARESSLDVAHLDHFVQVYQGINELNIGEVWALPIMLRLSILEALSGALANLTHIPLKTNPLAPGPSVEDPGPLHALDDDIVANAIRSLRLLATQDWKAFFEQANLVEKTLRRDPSQVYPRMDFDTRNRYRNVIEQLALGCPLSEVEIADTVLRMAGAGTTPLQQHIGYYLMANGRKQLEISLAYHAPLVVRLRNWLYQHALPVYLGSVFILSLFLTTLAVLFCLLAGGTSLQAIWVGCLAWLPASSIAVDLINWAMLQIIPPRILPKMNFLKGIPPEDRTMVVIPALLKGFDDVNALLRQIKTHFLANPDPNLCFAFLTDFADAPRQEMPGDQELVDRTIEGIAELNRLYGDQTQPFYFFHRRRAWNASEDCWMGWERKRGKLVEFNRLLLGKGETSYEVQFGDLGKLAGIRFIITLDADTVLPRESANRLVGTFAHPLNQIQYESPAGNIKTGYTVLQPRVMVRPMVANHSIFSRVYSGDQSLDLYTRAVSDIYQDLFGEGNYIGKGIYDIRAFERSLAGIVPDNHILSHDLFEGIHGRCGLVTDIVLFEDYPPTYMSFSHRLHRWVRGDWQLIPWLFPLVPDQQGGSIPNRLSTLDRWKIIDNLRRNLIAPATLLLLISSWFWLPGPPIFWMILAFSIYLFPVLMAMVSNLGKRSPQALPEPSSYRNHQPLLRALFEIAFLPHETLIISEAILTTLVRLAITRKHLLQWVTSAHSLKLLGSHMKVKTAWRKMIVEPLLAFSLLLAVIIWQPGNIWVSAFLLLFWMLSPYLAVAICQPVYRPPKPVSPDQNRMLRMLARATWLYFEHFAGPDDYWLPPDHFQEDPRGMVAHRTSPTNIGLLLTSTLSAYDLGYIGPQELALRLSNTFDGMDQLEQIRGHWLNWYDTRTLTTLPPRYISTVDSANLAACLLAVQKGCSELASNPIIQWDGMVDTLEVLMQTLQEAGLGSASDELHTCIHHLCDRAESLRRASRCEPKLLRGLFEEDREAMEHLLINLVETSAERMDIPPATWKRLMTWIDRTRHHISSLQRELQVLCPWTLALAGIPIGLLNLLNTHPDSGDGVDLDNIWSRILDSIPFDPSLEAIPDICSETLRKLEQLQRGLPSTAEDALRWSQRFASDLQITRDAAQDLIQSFQDLAQRAASYFDRMDFGFLFDTQRQVFHIGFNVESGRFDPNYYDLMASEARIAGLLAIARGDVPQSHWLHLARPLTKINGTRALISWGGGMFEYLMPTLLVKHYPDTLLEQSCRAAVEHQIAYGREKNIPWGISESSYFHFDANQVYQYRSFGVPGMGYKRDLADDTVVAPYASLLALPYAPQAVCENIARYKSLGMMGLYGLYEAMDFSTGRLAAGQKFAIIRSYMAHHQGMVLLALNNYLNDNPMPRRFHAHLRIRSIELLLQEQVSGLAPIEHPQPQAIGSIQPIHQLVSMASWQVNHHAPAPQIHCLTNGAYSLLITAAGSGYSSWRGLDLTRWRGDTTLDDYGTWLYVQDKEKNKLWSATFQPTGVLPDSQDVKFYPHKVDFERRDGDISLRTSISITANDDVEIRKITLTNHSERSYYLVLTSYAEVILASQAADRRHSTFNNLFIDSEYVADEHLLLFRRRLRDSQEKPVYLAHWIMSESAQIAPTAVETNRARFLGRGGNPRAPAGLLDGNLSHKRGATLDPIMALQIEIDLPPYHNIQIAFLSAAADSRKHVLELVNRYRYWTQLIRGMEASCQETERELIQIGLSLPVAHIQKLLSALLYPTNALRASSATIAANTLSQPGLWPFSISGDYPILLLRLKSETGLAVLYELLQAHTYWRRRGLKIDLVILNRRETSYEQDFGGHIGQLLANTGSENWINQRGGIFILREDQLNEAERILLETAAGAILDEEAGSLTQQLEKLDRQPVRLPKVVPLKKPDFASEARQWIERPIDLLFDNGLGGFSQDGREYVIYLQPGQWTPAPWSNVIAQPAFGCLVTEAGLGCTWAHNSGENRLTPWHNDPVRDPPSEAIYLRDEDTGQYWSPTPLPVRANAPYLIRHGMGYSAFRHFSHGLEQNTRVFIVPDAPVKIVQVRLENKSSTMRRISVTYYAEWVLGTSRDRTAPYLVPEFSNNRLALLARNPYNLDYGQGVAFLASTRELHYITTDRAEFLGRHGSYSHPAALERVGLAASLQAGSDPCAATQLLLWLGPGETKEVTFLLGEGQDRADADRLISHYQNIEHIQAAWGAVAQFWDSILGQVQVETPDMATNLMLNRWLLYQALSSRIWGRTAYYQSSGAFGFRDQMQDVLALVHTRPDLTRAHILRAARHQFEQGDVLHWWHPPAGRGIRTRCSDNLLWLPFATTCYVRTTADESILHEQVPFLQGEALKDDEQERYGLFSQSDQVTTLYDHCCRAILKGATRGEHGLPLIGAHDWNDGMNRIGTGGKGESIWLGWFLYEILDGFAGLCELMGDDEQAADFRSRLEPLRLAINQHGWDGNWYLRAYYDDGTSLGSHLNLECRIDSLSQSWSVLSGAAAPGRAQAAMEAVYQELVRLEDGLILLFSPPFDRTVRDTGYIQGYPPGIRENGGQYTHAALWTIWAFAKLGQRERAASLYRKINPIYHTDTPEKVARYRVEPYVAAADIYSVSPHLGRGGWTWYTGSASWMYRLGLESILGLSRRGNSLCLQPCIPPDWPGYTLHYRLDETIYHIQVKNPKGVYHDVSRVVVDGQVISQGTIPLQNDGKEHQVEVTLA